MANTSSSVQSDRIARTVVVMDSPQHHLPSHPRPPGARPRFGERRAVTPLPTSPATAPEAVLWELPLVTVSAHGSDSDTVFRLRQHKISGSYSPPFPPIVDGVDGFMRLQNEFRPGFTDRRDSFTRKGSKVQIFERAPLQKPRKYRYFPVCNGKAVTNIVLAILRQKTYTYMY